MGSLQPDANSPEPTPSPTLHACVACGAKGSGVFVCHHCGVAFASIVDVEGQRKALEELHGQLAKSDAPGVLLKNAFLPDDPRLLIDAGLRLLPMLENAAGQSVVAGRMRAIIIKLRLLGGDPTVARAIAELQAALDSYEKSDNRMGIVLGTIAVAIVALLVWKCG